ncbi:hypothetical protein BC829DRAFT_433669, partial [Chytridium lagenaria]
MPSTIKTSTNNFKVRQQTKKMLHPSLLLTLLAITIPLHQAYVIPPSSGDRIRNQYPPTDEGLWVSSALQNDGSVVKDELWPSMDPPSDEVNLRPWMQAPGTPPLSHHRLQPPPPGSTELEEAFNKGVSRTIHERLDATIDRDESLTRLGNSGDGMPSMDEREASVHLSSDNDQGDMWRSNDLAFDLEVPPSLDRFTNDGLLGAEEREASVHLNNDRNGVLPPFDRHADDWDKLLDTDETKANKDLRGVVEINSKRMGPPSLDRHSNDGGDGLLSMTERKASVNRTEDGEETSDHELEWNDGTPPSLDRHVDDGRDGMDERKASVNHAEVGGMLHDDNFDVGGGTPPSLDRHINEEDGLLSMAERKASLNHEKVVENINDNDIKVDINTPPSLDRYTDEGTDGMLSIDEGKASKIHDDVGEKMNENDSELDVDTPPSLNRYVDEGRDGLLSMAERKASVNRADTRPISNDDDLEIDVGNPPSLDRHVDEGKDG